MDRVRRNLLGGAMVAGAVLGVGKEAAAQNSVVSKPVEMPPPAAPNLTPQNNPDAEAIQAAISNYRDPKALKVVPVGQDWANLHRYHQANDDAKASPASARRVVMMGDSITDSWPGLSNGFFPQNGLVGRGISGQTTAQMVVRFWAEVIDLKPQVVHIMAGTNDIAENLDPYDFDQTTRNLMAMTALAKANGIRVVMGSVPPATSFGWRPERGNPSEHIVTLNDCIQMHCRKNGFVYADYWPVLANADGGLKPELGLDSVHPNAAGYALMGSVALGAIAAVQKKG